MGTRIVGAALQLVPAKGQAAAMQRRRKAWHAVRKGQVAARHSLARRVPHSTAVQKVPQ